GCAAGSSHAGADARDRSFLPPPHDGPAGRDQERRARQPAARNAGVTPPLDTSPMRPSAAYRRGVELGRWEPDEAQLAVLVQLDRIHDELLERRGAGFLGRVARRLRPPAPVRGLYLW